MKCFYVGSFLSQTQQHTSVSLESPEKNISEATQQIESRVFEMLVEIRSAQRKICQKSYLHKVRLESSRSKVLNTASAPILPARCILGIESRKT